MQQYLFVGKFVDLSLYMEFYVLTIQGIHANVFIVGVTSLYVYTGHNLRGFKVNSSNHMQQYGLVYVYD